MFQIRYGLGGGFGGAGDWEDCEEAKTLEQADKIAYEYACQDYDSYDGLHGLRDIEQIMEEDRVDEDEAEQIWRDERESWLDYEAREVHE